MNEIRLESISHAGRRPVVAGLIGALLLMLAMAAAPAPSFARMSVGIFVNFGPPALPVYVQPPCPAPGYMWTPGYWAWDPASGYYWVPGTWVTAPFVGALWTPGYWGFYGGGYRWYPGYWGLSVGFYGGINYGFGYTGHGYYGGYWRGGNYYYNREVNHITNVHITNVYNQRVVVNERGPRVSYNGGRGGINARPTREQLSAERGRRFGPVGEQMRQQQFARSDRMQRASVNHGRPEVTATPRAGEFHGRDAVRADRAGAPHSGPSPTTRGREISRPAEQNARFDNRAPVERVNQRPAYTNNQQRSFERNQPQARPQEVRRVENRPAPQQHGNSAPHEMRGGGNGHGGGNNHGGRGGRH
ncbi:MAG TPA: YXWGXW repeat-containing protein [Terriglobia bacterium]|nr:YXWGXW repeat-containing protein [Terriglobia bacterium]